MLECNPVVVISFKSGYCNSPKIDARVIFFQSLALLTKRSRSSFIQIDFKMARGEFLQVDGLGNIFIVCTSITK